MVLKKISRDFPGKNRLEMFWKNFSKNPYFQLHPAGQNTEKIRKTATGKTTVPRHN